MNALFQEYKRQVDNCRVIIVDEVNLPFKIEATMLEMDKKGHIDYDRAKIKRNTQQMINDYYMSER